MKIIREARCRLKLSQRKLAKKASISYKTLQLIESGHHNPRLATLEKISRVLGLSKGEIQRAIAASFFKKSDSIETISQRIAGEGEDSWKHWLFEFVDTFRHHPTLSLVEAPPSSRVSLRIQCLLASTVEFLCVERKITPPWWCHGVETLPSPWFVSGSESLKAMALLESPLPFRKRNIFVLDNFLSRA